MGRTFLPVMTPADDDVAAIVVMAVAMEVAALIFKFDTDALPNAGPNLIHGFAVREFLLNAENAEAKPAREHAEGEDDAELVDRRVSQRVEFKRRAGNGAIRKTGAAVGTASGTRARNGRFDRQRLAGGRMVAGIGQTRRSFGQGGFGGRADHLEDVLPFVFKT